MIIGVNVILVMHFFGGSSHGCGCIFRSFLVAVLFPCVMVRVVVVGPFITGGRYLWKFF